MSEMNYVVSVGIPIVTFVLGFLTSRFTMTKAERKAHQQTLYKNADELARKQQIAYTDFTSALKSYVTASTPTIEHFIAIATAGDRYFLHLKLTAEAVLSGNVDPILCKETLIPALREATEQSLPRYYEVLQEISAKKEFPYEGRLERANYESIYRATEKFA